VIHTHYIYIHTYIYIYIYIYGNLCRVLSTTLGKPAVNGLCRDGALFLPWANHDIWQSLCRVPDKKTLGKVAFLLLFFSE